MYFLVFRFAVLEMSRVETVLNHFSTPSTASQDCYLSCTAPPPDEDMADTVECWDQPWNNFI